MADRYAELRAAVNLDLPPLPWHAPGLAELHDADDVCVACLSDCDQVGEECRPVPSINEGDRFALYVVAANPEAIRALLADYDRLRDALWVVTEHNALHFGEGHNTVALARAALAQEQGESE